MLAFGRRDTLVGKLLSVRPLVAIGLISYSLYLWHQPVFAFARLRAIDEIPPAGYVVLIVLCIALATLSWRFVEQPFRQRAKVGRGAVFGATLAAGAVALVVGFGFDGTDGFASRNRELARMIEPSVGISKECDAVVNLKCATGSSPEIAVWGDSYARHLVDGIIASKPDVKLVQLTKNNCGPFFDLAPVVPRLGQQWPLACAKHNAEVKRFLLANKSIRYVVLSSQLSQYLIEDKVLVGGIREMPSELKTLTDNFRATLAWLEANGFETVFVAAPPRNGRDTGLCVARVRLLGDPIERCELPLRDVMTNDKDMLSVLADIADEYPVVSFRGYLCDEDSCKSRTRGSPCSKTMVTSRRRVRGRSAARSISTEPLSVRLRVMCFRSEGHRPWLLPSPTLQRLEWRLLAFFDRIERFAATAELTNENAPDQTMPERFILLDFACR
ncbi:hypothetical protein BC360_00245 [Ensifer sp. LC163]|nr:hypothetical protein BC360_00245 [Ensifer sp. LC163]